MSNRQRKGVFSWWQEAARISAGEDIPLRYEECVARPDSEAWKTVLQSEVVSLIEHDTGDLVLRPVNWNVISFKWVYAVKYEATSSGNVFTRYKARLFASGFLQVECVDFSET